MALRSPSRPGLAWLPFFPTGFSSSHFSVVTSAAIEIVRDCGDRRIPLIHSFHSIQPIVSRKTLQACLLCHVIAASLPRFSGGGHSSVDCKDIQELQDLSIEVQERDARFQIRSSVLLSI
jgi:hypothetical protein